MKKQGVILMLGFDNNGFMKKIIAEIVTLLSSGKDFAKLKPAYIKGENVEGFKLDSNKKFSKNIQVIYAEKLLDRLVPIIEEPEKTGQIAKAKSRQSLAKIQIPNYKIDYNKWIKVEELDTYYYVFDSDDLTNEGVLIIYYKNIEDKPEFTKILDYVSNRVKEARTVSQRIFPNYPWELDGAFRKLKEDILFSLSHNKIFIATKSPNCFRRIADLLSVVTGKQFFITEEKPSREHLKIMKNIICQISDKDVPKFYDEGAVIVMPTLADAKDNSSLIVDNVFRQFWKTKKGDAKKVPTLNHNKYSELFNNYFQMNKLITLEDLEIIIEKELFPLLNKGEEIDYAVKTVFSTNILDLESAMIMLRTFLSDICQKISEKFSVSAQFSLLKEDRFEALISRMMRENSCCLIIRGNTLLIQKCNAIDFKHFQDAFRKTEDDPFSIYQYECELSKRTCALKGIKLVSLTEETFEVIFSVGQYHVDKKIKVPQNVVNSISKMMQSTLLESSFDEPVFTATSITNLHKSIILLAYITPMVFRSVLLPVRNRSEIIEFYKNQFESIFSNLDNIEIKNIKILEPDPNIVQECKSIARRK